MLYFRIAEVTLGIQSDQELLIPDRFRPFLCEAAEPDVTAVIHETDRLPDFSGAPVYRDAVYELYPDEKGGFLRVFRDNGGPPCGAAVCDYAAGRAELCYLPWGSGNFVPLENCFFAIGWESLLLNRQRLILHAALVDTPFGGILFSGPSGIGKSTQADLWCRFAGGRLLNGDRPVLQNRDGKWFAWGAPYAGSSRCYINEASPVTAILLLDQGKTCQLERLPGRQAFRGIYSGVTANCHDRQSLLLSFDMASRLSRDVPVFHFTCTPDETAVAAALWGLKEAGVIS
ncbi:MAG: hypothetical protein IJ422_06335 [Oscillospiraceae bacterium]|nr:hypothetical protein [Oscillospiraceae bacterium]